MFNLAAYLETTSHRVDKTLEQLLPPPDLAPARLHQAMRHSMFGSGKRLRPILCLAAANAINPANPDAAMIPAAAVEILHTYTLIHDDLPAMDDDDLRRGRPTCHIAFDEATAILAGDALLTLAFGLLATTPCNPPVTPALLVQELAAAAGSTGVIGGQMADIEGEGKPMSIERLMYIHAHKTGDLITASVRLGALTVGAGDGPLAALTEYAEKIGLAFQVADDVLNATSTREKLGKSAGTDADAGKTTYVAAYGIEGARQRAFDLVAGARAALKDITGNTAPLHALADYSITRSR